MEYCECGSMKLQKGCSNKKCRYYIKTAPLASFRQVDYIRDMLNQLGRDEEEYTLMEMTSKEASRLIDELQNQLDDGE